MSLSTQPFARSGARRRLFSLSFRHSLVGFGFVLPAMLFFGLFNFYPIGYALYLSFTKWDMLSSPTWVGFDNFHTIFTNNDFLSSLQVTLIYTVETTIPLILLSLALALLLNEGLRGNSFFRVVYFIPTVMPAVVTAIVWGLLYAPTGAVNNILGLVGINPIPWISSAQYAIPALDIVTIWAAFGYNTIILLAGLQSISPEFHEAAAIDGASRWAILRLITLPLLAPRFLFVTSTTVAAVLTTFVLPYVMTNGGPGAATRVLPLLIYQSAFQFLNAGQASAMALVLLVITLVFTALQFRLFGREGL